jgi:7-cyano-7-deazaguanine reductase
MTEALGNKKVETYDLDFKKDLTLLENTVDKPFRISLECTEVSTFCPLTKAPDFGKLLIDYIPTKWIVETKALKEYLVKFRDKDMFQEEVVNQVCADLFDVMKPYSIRVRGEFNMRGGIIERVIAIRNQEDLNNAQNLDENLYPDTLGWIG